MAQEYPYVTYENLQRFKENLLEYYSDDSNAIHIGDNTTAKTRDIEENGSDHLATTAYVKNLVVKSLIGGIDAIPVKNIYVNGESTLKDGVGYIDIPILTATLEGEKIPIEDRNLTISLPIIDVHVNGESVVEDKIAHFDIPLKSLSINNHPLNINDYNINLDVKVNGEVIPVEEGKLNLDLEIPRTSQDIGATSIDEFNSLTNNLKDLFDAQEEKNTSFSESIKETNTRVSEVSEVADKASEDVGNIFIQKGQPLGFATLTEEGRLPAEQYPKVTLPVKVYETEDESLGKSILPSKGELGVIYVVKDTSKVLIWKDDAYAELGGVDSTLRETVASHVGNKENPHGVTKGQIGLEKVDNTSDLEKPISNATQEALNSKIDKTTIVDSLDSKDNSKVLSAKQGNTLKNKIEDLENKISGSGSVFSFEGTISSKDELSTIANPKKGDAYQIHNEEDPENGNMYAYNGSEWYQISSAGTDISSSIASLDEVYSIIENYEE